MPNLSVNQIEKLVGVLISTLDESDAALFLGLATGDDLYQEHVARDHGMGLRKLLRIVVTALDKEGILLLFLRVVYQRRPHKVEVRDYLRENFTGVETEPVTGPVLDRQERGVRQPSLSSNAAAPGLQSIVKPRVPHLDMLVWVNRAAEVSRRVCRIEKDRRSLGTGFLVGPDLVLTNWHVVRHALPANDTDDLACRFDFAAAPGGGIGNGEEIDAAPGGVLAWSPCSTAELTATPDNPPPGANELDFALLRLDKAAGNQRGWIDLTRAAPALEAGDPLLIVQHPAGAPLKLALDTDAVDGLKFDGLRLRYHTNTEFGSSGSPCLSMDWHLVALHHLGDPAVAKPVFNQGVPIDLVRDGIVAAGFGNLLVAPPA